MPHYRKHGKIVKVVTDKEFAAGMEGGRFANFQHKAFPVILYYSAVRKLEALRALKSQFTITDKDLIFDVGPRLKKIRRRRKGKTLSQKQIDKIMIKRWDQLSTPPLPLPLDAPYMNLLVQRVQDTEGDEDRVFPWCAKTGYNIIDRVFSYPHLFRLSRITWFFSPHPEIGRPRGFSIAEVKNFTGLSLGALDYYIGLADVQDMGRALYLEKRIENAVKGVN